MYQIIENEQVYTFDVDDTLILWDKGNITFNHIPVEIHQVHVEAIKKHKARGQFVIVWSAGGAQWAKEAVDYLGIGEYVDIVMRKPLVMYDDVSPEKWCKVIYLENK